MSHFDFTLPLIAGLALLTVAAIAAGAVAIALVMRRK